jgi:GNAT superfamily N-acetyltransferase
MNDEPTPNPGALRWELSWERSRLQIDRVHAALAASYWSPNIRRDLVELAAANSLTLGAYDRASGEQVAYARVVTDRATFAYLCDVIVFEGFRGLGIGKLLVAAVLAHPELQTIRRHALATRDAQSLYAQFGYEPVPQGNWMQRKGDPSLWQDVMKRDVTERDDGRDIMPADGSAR